MDPKEIIPRPEPLTDPASEAGFNLLAIDTVPSDPEDRLRLAGAVTRDIRRLFEGRLAPEDLALWCQDEPETDWTEPEKRRLLGMLDLVIIERAETLGWRVYLSPLVLRQMAEWHDKYKHGPQRLKELGKAVARAARVARGEDKLPISEPEWKQNKEQAKNELQRLFNQYRAVFRPLQARPSYQDACEWLRSAVEDSKESFPLLRVNMNSLFKYFEHAGKEDITFVKRLLLGNIRPASLFDEWAAWGRNLDTEFFRQSVSRQSTTKL
jgi:hypothetical protein